ncbi:MAG: DUF192 domain-containing protein [Candidatus ainarchaeum sp.]|nr:DUF192 domain-containing protein [Candidatus ainarchaeum sp.]
MRLENFEVAKTRFQRARGIMFRRRLSRPVLFVFAREKSLGNAVHSLFCFTRFDAIFLDRNKRVVDVMPKIAPFRPFVAPRAKAKYLIEAPPGWAEEKKVEVGEKIEFSL